MSVLNKMSDESLIVIGGGVGPLAGVKTAEQLVNNTEAKTDQDHPQSTLLLADKRISDRTSYLLDKTYRENNDSPAVGMANALKERILGFTGGKIVTGVPCNTFHAFADEYKNELNKISEEIGKEVVFVNMIEETAKMIKEILPNVKKIGLLSTTGTRELKLYNGLENFGIEIVQVSEKMQDELHDTIYNEEWGIKSSNHNEERTTANFKRYADNLKEQGAEALILGCTEIPLVLKGYKYRGLPLIDPVTALVRGLIREATNGEKLKKLEREKYLG